MENSWKAPRKKQILKFSSNHSIIYTHLRIVLVHVYFTYSARMHFGPKFPKSRGENNFEYKSIEIEVILDSKQLKNLQKKLEIKEINKLK